jgi:hypothetical protein
MVLLSGRRARIAGHSSVAVARIGEDVLAREHPDRVGVRIGEVAPHVSEEVRRGLAPRITDPSRSSTNAVAIVRPFVRPAAMVSARHFPHLSSSS